MFNFSVKFETIDRVSQKIQAINTKMNSMKRKADEVSARVKSRIGNMSLKATLKMNTKAALQKLKKVSERMKGIGDAGRNMAKDGVANLAASAGYLATIAFPLKRATEFESSFTQVAKVMTEPKEKIKEFRKELLGMTAVLPKSAEELAQIAEAGAKLGNKANVLPKFTEVAVKMSEAMGIPVESVGSDMGKIGGLLKYGIGKFEEFADRLNYIADNTAADGAKTLNIIKRTAGSFGSLGFATSDIVGISAVADMLSTSPEIAGSSLNRILIKLRGVSKYKKLLSDKKGSGFFEILKDVSKLSKDNQFQWIQDNIGKAGEAGQLVQKIVNNVELLESTLEVARSNDALGSLQREFEAVSATAKNKLRLMRNAMDRFAINAGTAFLPLQKQITTFATKVIDKLDAIVKKNPEAVMSFVKVVASIGGLLLAVGVLKVVLGTLAMSLGMVVGAIKAVRIAMLAFTVIVKFTTMISGLSFFLIFLKKAIMATAIAQRVLNLAMTMNPVGLIITGIAALASLFMLAYSNWGKITETLSGIWKGFLDNPLQSIINLFDTLFGKFEWFKKVKGTLGDAWSSVKSMWADSEFKASRVDNVSSRNTSDINMNIKTDRGVDAEITEIKGSVPVLPTVENGIGG